MNNRFRNPRLFRTLSLVEVLFIGVLAVRWTDAAPLLNFSQTVAQLDRVSAFDIGSSFALAVTTSGSGFGTVTSSPAGILCGGTCTASFPVDTQVTLSASAAVGSICTGWSGEG